MLRASYPGDQMRSVGLCFGVVQFFFVTSWTLYVIYLPQLAAQAGLPAAWVPWLLVADQAIFAVTDLAMGVAADRVVRQLGRIGRWMLGLTVVSALAFLALPWLAPNGSPALLLAATGIWAVTSSALRAPPMALLGRYVPKPSVPWMAALLLFGTGVAGALAPWLTVHLRGTDPRLPFVLATVALVLAVGCMVWAEQHLARNGTAQTGPKARMTSVVPIFFAAAALLAIGFQVHASLNAAPQYLRFAKPADLEWLMPTFWVGFSVAMVPASFAARRFGGVAVMVAGAAIGALAAVCVPQSTTLPVLVALQAVAGAAWGAVLMSAVAAAITIGSAGREGAATGGLFTVLAVATLARIAVVALQLPQNTDAKLWLPWAPPLLWAAGALLLGLLAWRRRATAAVSG